MNDPLVLTSKQFLTYSFTCVSNYFCTFPLVLFKMSDLMSLFLTSFFTGLRLRGRNSQRGQPMSLGHLFLAFFFGLLNSRGQKFCIFCSLFLVFLSISFLYSNMPTFVLQNVWSEKRLNRGSFGPRFLTFFV